MGTTSLTLVALFIGLFILIYGTIKLKIHPFFALLGAAFSFGIISGMGVEGTLESFASGMGGTIASIGLVITIGTVTGTLLEKSGAVETMAQSILSITGKEHAALGLGITGYFVSIPVFCDAAVVLLSPIAKRMSVDTKVSMTSMAISLTMGLHATHMLVPPTPGPLAVAGIVGANLGTVIAMGALVSIPVMIVSHLIGKKFGDKYYYLPEDYVEYSSDQKLPTPFMAFAPIITPIVLMLLKTVTDMMYLDATVVPGYIHVVNVLGEPVIALFLGMIIALVGYFRIFPGDREVYTFDGDFGEALKSAGQIVLIVGAGGAFGGVLQASELQDILTDFFSGMNIGILAPFLIGFIFRTAIGSGTVAMVTAATMIVPLLEVFGMASPMGRVIAMLACAAGGSMIFHGNDDFFWVSSSTLEMDTSIAYRVFAATSVAQSLVGLACVYVLKIIFL